MKFVGKPRSSVIAGMWPTVVALLLTVNGAVPGIGRTLVVSKSAGAEYSTIHAAIVASAPGDTIRIGPGRYDDFHPLVAAAWTRDVIAIIDKTGLTFIGAGSDSTIIGPESPVVGAGVAPAGIASISGASAIIIGMKFENVDDGIYWSTGSVNISGCHFQEYVLGVVAFETVGGVSVSDSEFSSNRSRAIGIFTNPSCDGLIVADCKFGGPGINESGIVAIGTSGVNISNCDYAISVAIAFDGTTGLIEDCVSIAPTGLAVWVYNASVAQLYRNQFAADYACVYANGWSVVSGLNNTLSGGHRLATIFISSQSQVTLSENDIVKSGEYAAMIGQYFYEIQTNDLTGNYWGTSDPDSIAAWIWDYDDDPVTRAHIEYIPFATSTVPTERASLGSLKALFLGR